MSFSLKRKDTLTPAATCMEFEDILLNGIGQHGKGKYRRIPLTGGQQDQIHRERKMMVVPGWGRRMGRECLVENTVSFAT